MSAMEMMLTTMLKAAKIDPEAAKAEFVKRIQAFEANVKLLNDTLIDIKKEQIEARDRQVRIEKYLVELCASNGIDVLSIQLKGTSADDNGREPALYVGQGSSETNSGTEHAD